MLFRKAALAVLLGSVLPASAGATGLEELRAPLLRGDFASVAGAMETAPNPQAVENPAAAAYYRGLAAFAVEDYPVAVSTLAKVAEQHSDKPVGLRAAAVATLALARNGDDKNACDYAGIVLPLMDSLPSIWRVWVEEAQRSSGCTP